MVEPVELITERLRLRQWKRPDWEAFAALNADPQVMAFFPRVLERSESDAMAERLCAQIAERGWGLWAVEVVGGKSFVGFVGLSVPGYKIPASPCVEIGWRLAREQWGKGYATEAALGALRVGFDTLGLDEIVSFTAVQNFRSRAVMERIGMHDTGQTFEHPRLPVDHALRLHVLYRLTRGRWSGQVVLE